MLRRRHCEEPQATKQSSELPAMLRCFWIASLVLAMTIMGTAHAATSYQVAHGSNLQITEHSQCRRVTNNHASGLAIFVPTATSTEWTTFYGSPPAGVTIAACVFNPYFVLVATSIMPNMGGLSGANSTCYTRLNADNWKGKDTSRVATAGKVRAFLCNGATCQNPLANNTYYFATTADATKGGASLTVQNDGSAPSNTTSWNGATYFSAPSMAYWTGRPSSSSSFSWDLAGTGGSSSVNNCSGWTNNTSGTGYLGSAAPTNAGRWSLTTNSCTSGAYLICMVDP